MGWVFIPNQFFGRAGKSVGLCCFLSGVNLRHKLKLQIPDEPEHAATHVGELGLQVVTPIPVHKHKLAPYLKQIVPCKIAS